MNDVLEVYERPDNPCEPVICLDEKPVQLVAHARKPQPMRPGRDARQDYEYIRCGTVNVFYAVEPKTGLCFPEVTQRRTCEDFAEEVERIERRYADAKKIHFVMDNLSSHSRNALRKRFGNVAGDALSDRFEFHFTPAHASWLNQAENGISKYSRGCLGQSRIESQARLTERTRAWAEAVNAAPQPLRWSFTREKAKKTFPRTKPKNFPV